MSARSPAVLRTLPLAASVDLGLPRTLFDERWRDAQIASRVALQVYRLGGFADASAVLSPLEPPAPPAAGDARWTDRRRFALGIVHGLEGSAVRFKGGAINELHRRYAYGPGRPTANFHAKIVCFGADSDGRFYLRASVGRFGGAPGSDARLAVRFLAGAGDEAFELGHCTWRGALEGTSDRDVLVRGRSELLADAFAALSAAEVEFCVRPEENADPRRRGHS